MKPYLAQHLKSKIPENEDTFFQSYLKSYDILSRDFHTKCNEMFRNSFKVS